MMHDDATTVADVLAAWDAGDTIWSVEMGGLGPGYEQAIQVLIIEILRDHDGKPLPSPKSKEADDWGHDTAHRLAELGFSGAQVGAARSVAYRILKDGYHETLESMRRHDADRLIQVSKGWPRAPELASASPAQEEK